MAKCKSCGADFVWLKTSSGKIMPVDITGEIAKSGFKDDQIFDPKTMTSHFATCPGATSHRKKK